MNVCSLLKVFENGFAKPGPHQGGHTEPASPAAGERVHCTRDDPLQREDHLVYIRAGQAQVKLILHVRGIAVVVHAVHSAINAWVQSGQASEAHFSPVIRHNLLESADCFTTSFLVLLAAKSGSSKAMRTSTSLRPQTSLPSRALSTGTPS